MGDSKRLAALGPYFAVDGHAAGGVPGEPWAARTLSPVFALAPPARRLSPRGTGFLTDRGWPGLTRSGVLGHGHDVSPFEETTVRRNPVRVRGGPATVTGERGGRADRGTPGRRPQAHARLRGDPGVRTLTRGFSRMRGEAPREEALR